MHRGIAIGAALVVTAVCAGGVTLLHRSWPSEGRSLPGTSVGGWVQPPEIQLEDWLEARRVQLLGREAYLGLPEQVVSMSLGALGVELDVQQTMKAVLQHTESGPWLSRLKRAWQARQAWVDLELRWLVNEETARKTLRDLAPQIYRAPVDARLDLVAHRRVHERAGTKLDWERTLAAIRSGGRTEGAVFVVATQPIAARVTESMLANVDVSKVLSKYETRFGGTGRGRARNIRQAASLLNGLVLAPGQRLSFNKVVGPRT
ncbi:peptidoglycan binding domain-containing protein, partial [Myxococcota bacterium]